MEEGRGGRPRALAVLALACMAVGMRSRCRVEAGSQVPEGPVAAALVEGQPRVYPLGHFADRPVCGGVASLEPGSVVEERDGCLARVGQLPLGTSRLLGLPSDLNRLEASDFESIDGIGPKLARQIVEARRTRGPFASVEDLDAVPGIGPARLAALRAALNPNPP